MTNERIKHLSKGKRMKTLKTCANSVLVLAWLVCLSMPAISASMTTAFTYQGQLIDANSFADGEYDFQFKIYDDASSGSQVGSAVDKPEVEVADGYFTVELDFGPTVFDGNDCWLEMGIRPGNLSDPNTYTLLSPRQKITPAPYALQTRGIFTDTAGNVGIGTNNPTTTLEVSGIIYSNTGGFKFPNGTIQTTAAAGVSYHHVFTVAQSGGTYPTITQAYNACTSPSSTNTYLIRVMPGTYNESVTCKSYVTLQGSGKYVSYIYGQVTAANDCIIDGFCITGGIVCNATCPTITHNIITNGAGDGIYVLPVTSFGKPLIKQNEIVDCEGWGIHCDGWNSNAWIIANKIERNENGGICCTNSSPTISNNQIYENHHYGIYVKGAMGQPAEPTIDDNIITHTDRSAGGIGIYITNRAEPFVTTNNLACNFTGIEIHPDTQPSILANLIAYNDGYGIICLSSGASNPVTIEGNHIHSNTIVGVDIINCAPIVTHNNINDPLSAAPDIQYDTASTPMISLNVFDNITFTAPGTATGSYNVDSAGNPINPY